MAEASEDMINCNVCGQEEPLTKRLKCSKCGAKNWGQQLHKKPKYGCLWEILVGILLLGGYVAYDEIKEYNNSHWTQDDIEKSFSKNVVLVYHQFVYELKFDDPAEGSLFFVKTGDGGFTQWQKGMQPNEVTGCGFITKQDGTCVTTVNLSRPTPSELDWLKIKREVQIFRGPPFNIRSGGQYKIFTVKLGYYDHGSKINDPASFNSCLVTGGYEKETDIITPQNGNKKIEGITEFNNQGTRPNLEKGEEIFFIGYPLQIGKTENLNTLVTKNKIDSMRPYEFYFPVTSLFTLEGAPVFNKKGNVMGLTTVDEKEQKIKAIRLTFARVKTE